MASRFSWLSPALLLAASGCYAFAAGPVVFHVSDPIHPGETALLFGDSIGEGVTAEGWRVPESGPAPKPERLHVLQASDVSAKVVIPAEWKPGEFAIELHNAAGTSKPIYLNRTDAWWYLPAYSGEEFRVFGKDFGASTTGWLTGPHGRVALKTVQAEAYAARFRVPASVAAGDYELHLSNGWGGAAGVSPAVAIAVKKREPWPSTVYNVKSFGAAADGIADDSAALRAALAKAESAGGGVVFLPGGRYKISGKFVIPPHTVVRGEKRELVWLYVPKETPEFDAVFAGNRNFAIEELSLVAQTAVHLVAAPDLPTTYRKPWGTEPPKGQPGASNVRLHRLRLQHLTFAHRVNKGDPRREMREGYSTIALSGEDLELSDSEVISSGMPIAVHSSHRLRIERNRLDTGRQGWYGLWNSNETVIENNIIEGRDLEASYGGMQNRSDRLYYAGNRLQDSYGGEREALTFDTPYAPRWMGHAGEVTANGLTTREIDGKAKTWNPGELAGEICLIAYGKGIGEYVQIKDNTADTITLERPWDVLPDASSYLVIRTGRSQIVVTRNHFTDASAAVQFYAQSYGIIVDGNQAERTGGMYGLAWDFWWQVKNTRRYSTCMFNQWLNNDLGEGFIYQQGAWLNGMMGPAASAGNGHLDPPAAAVLGNIVRNNRLSDHNTLGALLTGKHPFALTDFGTSGYLGRDTIIEGNTVTGSPVGIDVYPGYRDTVVRHNKVGKCPVPLSDDGVNTWVDPGERGRMQAQAVEERFGVRVAPGAWPAVTEPVEAEVAAMLAGLHVERGAKGAIRLRTEPWVPEITASAAGKSVVLKPNVVGELPQAETIELAFRGAKLRVRL